MPENHDKTRRNDMDVFLTLSLIQKARKQKKTANPRPDEESSHQEEEDEDDEDDGTSGRSYMQRHASPFFTPILNVILEKIRECKINEKFD